MNKDELKEKYDAKKKELESKRAALAKEREIEESKKSDALVTCRVLFISALDKIYIGILLLFLAVITFINFKGDFGALNYNFFGRLGKEILYLIGLFILYLFMNYLYKCVSKTMLCLTKNEVYKEKYLPFKRREISIPLNKITGVSTNRVFYIFRSVTIHQYGKLPMIFFTWNNKEFKDKLTELITTEKDGIKNAYKNKNLLTKDSKLLKIIALALAGVIVLLSIIRFFGYMANTERKISGTYEYGDKKIVLKKDATCDITSLSKFDILSCEWRYDEKKDEIIAAYEYRRTSDYFGDITEYNYFTFKYSKDKKTLTYDGKTYKK